MNFILNGAKAAAHQIIEFTFPSNGPIAVATAWTSWYAYRVGIVESGPYIREKMTPLFKKTINALDSYDIIPSTIKDNAVYVIAPVFVPELIPYASLALSIAAGCTVSFTLNTLRFGAIKVIAVWDWVFSEEESETAKEKQATEKTSAEKTSDPSKATPEYSLEEPEYRIKEIDSETIEALFHDPSSIHTIFSQGTKGSKKKMNSPQTSAQKEKNREDDKPDFVPIKT